MGKRKKSIPIKRKEIEVFCHDNYSEYANRWFLRDRSVYSLNPVKYKDTGKTAPDFVVYCTLIPYMLKVFRHGRQIFIQWLNWIKSMPNINTAESEKGMLTDVL